MPGHVADKAPWKQGGGAASVMDNQMIGPVELSVAIFARIYFYTSHSVIVSHDGS